MKWHGDHIVLYESNDDRATIDFGQPAVRDAHFPEGMGYFENPRLQTTTDVGLMASNVSPLPIAFPSYVPERHRLFGCHIIRSLSGAVSDMAITWIEAGVTERPLAFHSRPMTPDDAALTVFVNRRVGPVVGYPSLMGTRVNENAGILQLPHDLIKLGNHAAIHMRFESTDPARPLRGRRIPFEFITWYDSAFQGWVSVHSFTPYGEALRVARSIVEAED